MAITLSHVKKGRQVTSHTFITIKINARFLSIYTTVKNSFENNLSGESTSEIGVHYRVNEI